MKKFNKILSLLMAIAMVLTMLPGAALATTGNEAMSTGTVTATKIENPGFDLKNNNTDAEKVETESYLDTDMVDVIVVMNDKSLLEHGYSTNEISTYSLSVSRRIANLREKQEDLVSRIKAVVGSSASTFSVRGQTSAISDVSVTYYYNVILAGLAIKVPYGALDEIKSLKGVKDAFVAPVFSVPEDMSTASTESQPNMYATQSAFGSASTWSDLGYTGAGMRIAILDTGLDVDHPSFAADPELNEYSLTKAEVESVLPSLNAAVWYEYEHGETLTADDVYYSAKIPFMYNYGFNNTNVTHDSPANDHGTHVAGIAAANKVEGSNVMGVAPDAQIIALKVFNAGNGAATIDIIAAMEDAFRLNVDVMNLSLGSDAGFTQMDELFDRILESDMIVSISAGNSYSSAYGNQFETNTNLTSDPDNGLVGWPGTMIGATTVASIENNWFMTNYIALGDKVIAYADANIYTDLDFTYLEGDWQYVMVPGLGSPEDFAQVDVAGKIAVVSRGDLSFIEKETNAADAGAIACIVYDSVDGGNMIYMQSADRIPSVFISKADGQALADAAVNGVGTFTVKSADEFVAAPNPQGGIMSSFSSWGGAPDLRLVPNVTAPGGSIYSTVDPAISGMGSYYATMSGTSMSAPHIAGMSALVLQYLREEHSDLTAAEIHTVAEALIMSTATPVLESTGVPYSPRKQGAGLANVYDAIISSGYLTVEDNYGKQPSVSLGDDDDKTGVYNFEFTINNLSGEKQLYSLDAEVLTDYVDLTYANYGYLFMGETSLPLDAEVIFSLVDDSSAIMYDLDGNQQFDKLDVQYLLDYVNGISGKTLTTPSHFDLNSDGLVNTADVLLLKGILDNLPTTEVENFVEIPAASSVTFKVKIVLSEDSKAYMDTYYPNGIYVDGFVRCYSLSDDIDLSLPFLAFYGDWSEAGSVFDTGWWYEIYAGDGYTEYNRYPNMLWTNLGTQDWLLGMNLYVEEDYTTDYNVLSPNGDGYQDAITEIYLGMMRNAIALEFTWTDSEGNVLFQRYADGVRKSVYRYEYRICYPFVYSDYIYQVDENGDVIWTDDGYPIADLYDYSDLENGDKVTLTINAWLDDGNNVIDETIIVPIAIDTEAPVLDSIEYKYNEETDERVLHIVASDNHDIAALLPLTVAGEPIENIAVHGEKSADGETFTLDLDVSGYDSTFYLVLTDYGMNEQYYEITFSGENNADSNKFYGFRRYSAVPYPGYEGYYITTEGYNGWVSFKESDSMVNHTYMYNNAGAMTETAVAAAEYIDGYVIGVDVEGTIFAMKSGDWTRIILGTMPEGRDADYEYVPYPALDMAYDYKNNVLYVLTDELVAGDGGHLLAVDFLSGDAYVTDLGIVRTSEGSQPLTLACDNDGVLYTIDFVTGDLYTIDPADAKTVEPENWWEDSVTYIDAKFVGATGYTPAYQQSMTVDHETGKLYWLAFSGVTEGYSYLFEVNKTTGELTVQIPSGYDGTDFPVQYNSEVVALYKPFKAKTDLIPDAELEALVLNTEIMVLGANNAAQLVATPYPFNAETGDLTWTSSDESVAVVSDGVVFALSEGRTVITVSNGKFDASCVIDVISLNTDLTFFDMGNTYYWVNLNAGNPGNTTFLEDAALTVNGFTAAAYFDGYVYVSEYGGAFLRLDAETMQGGQIGSTGNTLLGMAFNYADGYMYAIEMNMVSMMESYYYIVRVNLGTGELERLGQFNSDYTPMGFLAIDHDGNFYSIAGDNWTYGICLLKWNITDGGMNIVKSWDIGETVPNLSNYTSLVYSAEDDGLFFTDSAGELFWVDAASLTNESAAPRIVSLGYAGESTGYAMNMGMFTVPNPEPDTPYVSVDTVTIPENYLVLVGGSASAGISVTPWNAYPEITYATADDSVAAVDAQGNITGVSVGTTTLTVTVDGVEYTAPITVCAAAGELYGYLLSDFSGGSSLWLSFSDTDPVYTYDVIGELYDLMVYSGAYFDGKLYVYGQDQNGDLDFKNYFCVVDAETFEFEIGAKIHYTLRDMAFDYTTGNLYAIAEGDTMIGAVAQVNTETGEVTIVADTGKDFAAMTIDANGQMYGIGEDDNLYAIDKETGALTLIGATGADAGALFQSMHYDMNTGNTYWAQVANNGANSSLRLVDLTTGSTTNLGTITLYGCEISALYTIPGNEPTEPKEDTVEVDAIKLPEVATVVAGETIELTATVLAKVELKPSDVQTHGVQTPNPFVPVEDVTVTWSSSDVSIATVDQNGVVTGVSAGTVKITASVGEVSATCTVTVTAAERKFFAYDELNNQWISFSGSNTEEVTVVRKDEAGETAIQAAYYTGTEIYAVDKYSSIYSIDPDTFERTLISDEFANQTITVEYEMFDWMSGQSVPVELICSVRVVDMSYDNGKLYALVSLTDDEYGMMLYPICEINTETGEITILYLSEDIKPGNLLVKDGMAFYVDCYMSGMLSVVNLNSAEPTYSQYALIQDYWGYPEASRSLYLDTLTGTVYAFRDYTEPEYDEDWNEVYTSGAASLCVLNLADADIEVLGTVGEGLLLSSLFLR